MAGDTKRVTIEDVLGEFGFRVRWSVLDHWADVEAWTIVSPAENGQPTMFEKIGWQGSGDDTPDIDQAQKYLDGYVKWDGCTELSEAHHHWCGPHYYKQHIALLEYIYRRAYELMGREPFKPWESE